MRKVYYSSSSPSFSFDKTLAAADCSHSTLLCHPSVHPPSIFTNLPLHWRLFATTVSFHYAHVEDSSHFLSLFHVSQLPSLRLHSFWWVRAEQPPFIVPSTGFRFVFTHHRKPSTVRSFVRVGPSFIWVGPPFASCIQAKSSTQVDFLEVEPSRVFFKLFTSYLSFRYVLE